MSSQKFKVKTADGESWEWEIHSTQEEKPKDGVAWNKAAVVCLALGLTLGFVGLVTLLVSIGLLFTGPAAFSGMIAGSVLLGVGFLMATPSAIHLTRENGEGDGGKDREREGSVSIILPTPDFKKVTSKPQEPKNEDERYLLTAERLTAMIDEAEADGSAVSSAKWTPTPSPRGSPTIQRRSVKIVSTSLSKSASPSGLSPPSSSGLSLPSSSGLSPPSSSTLDLPASPVYGTSPTASPRGSPRGSPRVIKKVFRNSGSVHIPHDEENLEPTEVVRENNVTTEVVHGGDVYISKTTSLKKSKVAVSGPRATPPIAMFEGGDADFFRRLATGISEPEESSSGPSTDPPLLHDAPPVGIPQPRPINEEDLS